MTPQEKYIKDTNQLPEYIKWLESQIVVEDTEPEIKESTRDIVCRLIDSFYRMSAYETEIDYDAKDLSYQTQIIFPRVLTLSEKEDVENIITYWSNIPYVSVEGNYGIEWSKIRDNTIVTISVDFTKSASDDYCSREILEKLAEWVWQGTPLRKDKLRKYYGAVKPLVVRADCP